jgi:predicted RNA-binding Zn-ribbon protein involved in translation (DUF1610 family)
MLEMTRSEESHPRRRKYVFRGVIVGLLFATLSTALLRLMCAFSVPAIPGALAAKYFHFQVVDGLGGLLIAFLVNATLYGGIGIWIGWHQSNQIPTGAGRCVECDYNVRGNTSGFCPECGAGIPRGAKKRNITG